MLAALEDPWIAASFSRHRPCWQVARCSAGFSLNRRCSASRWAPCRSSTRGRRACSTAAGDGGHQHAVRGDVHLRPRHRRTAVAESAAAGSRHAAIRHVHVSRRQLRDAASAVLPRHGHQAGARAGPRRLRRARGRHPAGAAAEHEGDCVVRGRHRRRRARVRSRARGRALGSAVHVRVLAQSAHAQFLARAGRGLPALVRRRRSDVGQRTAGAARQRARHESRRRRCRRPAGLLLPVLRRRGEDRRHQRRSRARGLHRAVRMGRIALGAGRSRQTARSSPSGGCS